MEIASGVMSGARVALQVIAGHSGPSLEIYHELQVQLVDEEIKDIGMNGQLTGTTTKRTFADPMIAFYLINVGGKRAENVKLDIKQRFHSQLDDVFLTHIRDEFKQIASGQVILLVRMHPFEVDEERMTPNSRSRFVLDIHYDAVSEWTFYGVITIVHKWIRKAVMKKPSQFTVSFEMNAYELAGSCPAAKR